MTRICEYCADDFSPIEGNETRDFCSDHCESEYYAKLTEMDEYLTIYNEGYGRKIY